MTSKDAIKGTIDLAHSVTTQFLSDMDDNDLMVRPVPSANHIAWQLGHLIASEHGMLSAVGVDMPALPKGFAEAHSKEAASSDDASNFNSKAEYLELMGRMHDATRAALDAMPDAELDKAAPEEMAGYAPTVGAVFNLIGAHELMHVGQFATVRRKQGKPIVI